MSTNPPTVVELLAHELESEHYEQFLTEIAEIIYDHLGPSEKSITTSEGSAQKPRASVVRHINQGEPLKETGSD